MMIKYTPYQPLNDHPTPPPGVCTCPTAHDFVDCKLQHTKHFLSGTSTLDALLMYKVSLHYVKNYGRSPLHKVSEQPTNQLVASMYPLSNYNHFYEMVFPPRYWTNMIVTPLSSHTLCTCVCHVHFSPESHSHPWVPYIYAYSVICTCVHLKITNEGILISQDIFHCKLMIYMEIQVVLLFDLSDMFKV